MGYSMSQSLISSQPPLIVFTLCLTAFGCTMIVLAYVIGEQEVPNPDVQMDWNNFFKKMADLKLCHLQNHTSNRKEGSDSHATSDLMQNSTSSRVVDESKSMSAVLSNVVDSTNNEVSPESTFVEMSLKVKFNLKTNLPLEKYFTLKGKLKGKLLGLSGKYAHLTFNISLNFKSLENSSCVADKCSSLFEVCIYMKLPSNILPKTKGPDVCRIKSLSLQEALPVTFSDVVESKDSSSNCIDLDYTPDAKLTEMLTQHDRSIVNLHLMHTSYFMFVMVMTLVCYSLIRGRYRQPKTYHSLHKVPLDA